MPLELLYTPHGEYGPEWSGRIDFDGFAWTCSIVPDGRHGGGFPDPESHDGPCLVRCVLLVAGARLGTGSRTVVDEACATFAEARSLAEGSAEAAAAGEYGDLIG